MTTPVSEQNIRDTLDELWNGSDKQSTLTMNSALPRRTQRIEITRRQDTLIAASTVLESAPAELRLNLFEWCRDLELIYLRLEDDTLAAYLHIPKHLGIDEQLLLLAELARIADRLEYEVTEGDDHA
jgi:hypothetical protein